VEGPRDHDETIGERAFFGWLAAASEGSITLKRLVEETSADARPALESALFVVEMERDAEPSSLEIHEAAAMWTLLGRLLGSRATTATAALEYAASILGAIEARGHVIAPAVRATLLGVFIEGYVLTREEHVRASLEAEHLASLVPRRVGDGIDLLVLDGPYDATGLAAALEAWVRDVFRSGTRVAIIDLLGAREIETIARPLREVCLVLVSLGVETVLVGEVVYVELPVEVKRASSFEEGLVFALSARDLSSFAMARMRRLFTRS
jgi:hypothetical protein